MSKLPDDCLEENETKWSTIMEKIEFNRTATADQKAAIAKKEQEEKVQEEQAKDQGGWTNEEIALLTKGITRFPPGTTQRWKIIAEFVGSRTPKEVIKKAQELAERRGKEMEERRD